MPETGRPSYSPEAAVQAGTLVLPDYPTPSHATVTSNAETQFDEATKQAQTQYEKTLASLRAEPTVHGYEAPVVTRAKTAANRYYFATLADARSAYFGIRDAANPILLKEAQIRAQRAKIFNSFDEGLMAKASYLVGKLRLTGFMERQSTHLPGKTAYTYGKEGRAWKAVGRAQIDAFWNGSYFAIVGGLVGGGIGTFVGPLGTIAGAAWGASIGSSAAAVGTEIMSGVTYLAGRLKAKQHAQPQTA